MEKISLINLINFSHLLFSSFQSSDCQIYLNITTVEEQKITVELSGQGFCIVSQNAYDTIQNQEAPPSEYFETPYSLLDKISPGYRKAFGDNLEKALRKLSQEQNQQNQ